MGRVTGEVMEAWKIRVSPSSHTVRWESAETTTERKYKGDDEFMYLKEGPNSSINAGKVLKW